MERRPEFADILEALGRHEVEHILVGGVAAVLAPRPRLDPVDVVAWRFTFLRLSREEGRP